MTSSNGNIFRVTGPLCVEFTGQRWIPRTKASDAEHWCFLWSAAWINGWVNNGEAGDLRRNRSHCDVIVMFYSIHVLGWLQKWLNLITAPGSVSNEPGSVTWLATKYLKTASWRNHTEKLTTWWPQNISFWLKINIPSSYFTILMLNCLENTLKLQFDSYVTAVKFLTKSISKQLQPDLTFQHCWNQSRF